MYKINSECSPKIEELSNIVIQPECEVVPFITIILKYLLVVFVPAIPDVLRYPFAVQMQCDGDSSRCMINTLWRPPLNAVAANVTNYLIRVNTRMITEPIRTFNIDDNETGISYLLPVRSCATHNVSISTLNTCGEGPNTHNFVLKPEDIIPIPDLFCSSGCTNIYNGKL